MLLAAAATLVVLCLPLLLSAQLPLVDMPAHLARIEIIDQLLKGGPLADFWEFEPGLVPNLFFDAVGLALHQAFPVELVGVIYLVLALTAQLLGTVLLHRSLHGHYSYWPLIAALLLYNISFFYGYLSYLAGVGLALLSLALWIRLRDRPAPLRIVAGSVAAILLFLAHIVPLVVYAAAVGGYELQRAVGLRRRPLAALGALCAGAAQFLAPAVLFLSQTPTAGLADEAVAYRLEVKIGSLLATPTSGAAGIDVAVLLAMAAVALLVPLAGKVRFASTFAAAFACVLLAFALMPWGVGPAVNLDVRMPLSIMLLAMAATDVTVRRGRLGRMLACAVAAMVLVRTVSVGSQAAAFSDRLDAYRDAFRRLPEGTVLFTSVNNQCPQLSVTRGFCRDIEAPPPTSLAAAVRGLLFPEIYRSRLEIPRHVAALASIDRDVFVPQIFATRGLQPIAVRTPLAGLKLLQGENPMAIHTDEQLQAVRAQLLRASELMLPGRPVFLLQQRIAGALDLAPEGGAVVARGPEFTLYQLSGPFPPNREGRS
ncbi:MAG: hypothetical protein ACXW25_11445 [Rhodospirillales bacterium]